MKEKMFFICTSIAALHLVIGGAFMLGGCTGVQEDEPMPKDARIVKQETAQQPEAQQPEVQKPETEPQVKPVDAPVVDEPVVIDVPVEKPEAVKAPAQEPVVEEKPAPVQPKVRESDIEYVIKKGDTYTKISKEFGVSLKDLMAYNTYPEKRLIPGRKIMIPATGKKITAKVAAPAVKVQKSYEAIPADGIYVVKKNDSYSKIAGKFGLRASDIAEYNNLPLTKAIQPGQKLRLPPRRAGKATKAAAKPAAKTTAKPAAKKPVAQPAEKPAEDTVKPAEKPAVDTGDNIEDLKAPSIDNIEVPSASISKPAQDATVAEVVTEDTTVAKLALEYARSEMDLRKLNPHLAADGNVKRGTKIVL